ncbi:hypothetical protein CPHO_05465 [Corynebacterium phocae]|uniref:Solute-binding protein family 5 domain-containing protein n=1 Tax=Corynebacterium phocae TaxID=161895 RepID=A0A1L7D6E5_9CORY|nr:hypothetical protein CPHO_05465 [Corynebacterium phocae]
MPATPAPPKSTDYFGYQVPSGLVTTNAGSAFGAASNAQFLSGRLYPAAFLPGPDGQLIPNTDLVTAEETPPTPEGLRQIHYSISPHADFSDGVPVTCEDFLLAYTAGSMPSLFGAHLPLAHDIDHLDCAAGAKDFNVVLKPGLGDRWRYLFGPGSVLPSHVIADNLGMSQEDLVARLVSWDPAQIGDIAHLWRWGFMLGEFDPQMQVSYGPFVIDHVGPGGEVILVPNKSYYGDQPHIEKLVVWPSYADTAELISNGALRIADTTGGVPDWATQPPVEANFEVVSEVGELTETLILSDSGLFSDEAARQAFAACVDQDRLAAISSEKSGMAVTPVFLHSLRHNDPISKQLAPVAEPHRGVDIPAASALTGTTVKVGYLGPDPRFAAMVEALRLSCEPAGINVVDSATESMSATYLEVDPETGLPTIDAFLGAVDPMTEYSTVDSQIRRVEDLKRAEEELWRTVPTIPVAAQPRTFVIDKDVANVVPYTGLVGIGWNMDRWALNPAPTVSGNRDSGRATASTPATLSVSSDREETVKE